MAPSIALVGVPEAATSCPNANYQQCSQSSLSWVAEFLLSPMSFLPAPTEQDQG